MKNSGELLLIQKIGRTVGNLGDSQRVERLGPFGIGYYSNCSHIQSIMWILFVGLLKYGLKLDYVADYIRNQNKPHSLYIQCGFCFALLRILIGPSITVTTEAKSYNTSIPSFWLNYVSVTIKRKTKLCYMVSSLRRPLTRS